MVKYGERKVSFDLSQYLKGVVPLKTTVEKAIVEVSENDRNRRYSFPIRNKDGELMTHRLKRLMGGKLSTRHCNGPDMEPHFIEMVWKPPYTLLQELRTENRALKSKLIHMDGCGHLVIAEPPMVPKRARHDVITQMVRDELKLYYSLRRRIKAHEKP